MPEDSRSRALRICPALQDIQRELSVYENLLRRWQARINLVSRTTLDDLWVRHFADSLQLLLYAPEAKIWADFGSGAGFPGLVLAIALKGRPGSLVHLIESDTRKAAFLREVSRETAAPAQVHAQRIDMAVERIAAPEIVTARALAPLSTLLDMTLPWLKSGTRGLFLLGGAQANQLTGFDPDSTIRVDRFPSCTGAGSVVAVSLNPAASA